MDSIQRQSRAGCSIKPPQEWSVQAFPNSIVMVLSPDGEAFSLVEFITGPASQKPVNEILGKGLFRSTSFFPKAKPPEIAAPASGDSATALVHYLTPKGVTGRARVTCLKKDGNVVLLAYAAPESFFAKVEPLLQRNLELFGPSSASPLPQQPQHQPPPPQQHQPQQQRAMAQLLPLPQSVIDALNEPNNNPWQFKTAGKAFNNMDAYIRDDPPKTKTEAPEPVPFAEPVQPLQKLIPQQPQTLPAQHQQPSVTAQHQPIPAQQRPAQQPVVPQHQAAPPQHQAPQQPVHGQHQPATPQAATNPYVKFTEPEKGTYTMEVPHGWQVKGGFNHPLPGDRRPWIEAVSPEGIYIACDPSFPQNFCHFRDQFEGRFAAMAAGGQLLNLKPSAQRVADFYVENFASRHFGPLQLQQRRPRPDMVDLLASQFRQNGVPISRKWQLTSDEMLFNFNRGGQPLVLSVLATAAFNGEYTMWTWAFWNADIYLYVAPPQLVARAEQVRAHIKASMQLTPRFMQIYQQDEAQIAANGRQAHATQVNWFSNQQTIHRMQTDFGNSIIANYWSHNR